VVEGEARLESEPDAETFELPETDVERDCEEDARGVLDTDAEGDSVADTR
jgi:hypothetical protein